MDGAQAPSGFKADALAQIPAALKSIVDQGALSGVVTRDAIARALPWSTPSGSSSSYGGNPLAAAAGSAALRIIDEEHLVENARVVGDAMLRELQPFVDDYPFVGEVRGRGLLLAIELVRNKRTRQPLPDAVTRRIYDACVQRGLLTMAIV